MNWRENVMASLGNLASAVEFIKEFFEMIKAFFASLFESFTMA